MEIPLKTAPRFKNLMTTYYRILILLLDPSEGYIQELIYYVCLRLRVVIGFVMAYDYILRFFLIVPVFRFGKKSFRFRCNVRFV